MQSFVLLSAIYYSAPKQATNIIQTVQLYAAAEHVLIQLIFIISVCSCFSWFVPSWNFNGYLFFSIISVSVKRGYQPVMKSKSLKSSQGPCQCCLTLFSNISVNKSNGCFKLSLQRNRKLGKADIILKWKHTGQSYGTGKTKCSISGVCSAKQHGFLGP